MTDIIYRNARMDEVDILKRIWKITFGDSMQYIDLVFNNYFNSDYSVVAIYQNNIIASLIGIEYTIVINNFNTKGLYLCGLATLPEFRGRGIMKNMLEIIHHKSQEAGLSSLFLIPADDHLRRYYQRLGYNNTAARISYKCRGNFDIFSVLKYKTYKVSSADSICNNIFLINSYNDFIASELYKIIINKCINYESEESNNRLLHSYKDMQLVIQEKFLSGEIMIFNSYSGVIFTINDANAISFLSGGNKISINNVLPKQVNKDEREDIISGLIYESLSSLIGDSEFQVVSHTSLYGQIRFNWNILQRNFLNCYGSENPIFQSDYMLGRKYSKMNFQEFSKTFRSELPGTIHLSYLLD